MSGYNGTQPVPAATQTRDTFTTAARGTDKDQNPRGPSGRT